MKRIVSMLMIVVLLLLQVSAVFADETFYVQVGAFESKSKAEKYSAYMKSIGYDSVMITVYDLHKVFLGPYDTEERAREILADYRSVGGEGFFVIGSQMYYQRPKTQTEPVVDVTEEEVEDEETAVEETVEEEVIEEEETTEEVAEEEQEEVVEEETEDVPLEIVVEEDIQEIDEEKDNYKVFTIVLIVVLWIIFIVAVVIYRLNQNKNNIE